MNKPVSAVAIPRGQVPERLQKLYQMKAKLELADRPAMLHAVLKLIALQHGVLASRGIRPPLWDAR